LHQKLEGCGRRRRRVVVLGPAHFFPSHRSWLDTSNLGFWRRGGGDSEYLVDDIGRWGRWKNNRARVVGRIVCRWRCSSLHYYKYE